MAIALKNLKIHFEKYGDKWLFALMTIELIAYISYNLAYAISSDGDPDND